MPQLCFAYYCSGHGYGHATRVSAFACHLLSLPVESRPLIYIISSAPEHVFSDSIKLGAVYRYAVIDPVIVQPLAYRVDRQKSVEVLKSFINQKEAILEVEKQWLSDVRADCVLSDAAFLGCLAAKAAGKPCILITNFTFDSVYSYLSTSLVDYSSPQPDGHLLPYDRSVEISFMDLVPDVPVPQTDLAPLVDQIHAGYRCADLLMLLPGYIPIPSFTIYPTLPSSNWVDPRTNHFHPNIIDFLNKPVSSHQLYPSLPSPPSSPIEPHGIPPQRKVIAAPLLVRSPSSPSVYTPEGRSRLLSSIGVPAELHNPLNTKVLIVSFGGQVFRRPSRSGSRSISRGSSPEPSPNKPAPRNGLGISHRLPDCSQSPEPTASSVPGPHNAAPLQSCDSSSSNPLPSPRLATPSHLWIPGAPPASKPITALPTPPPTASAFVIATIPPTPLAQDGYFNLFTPDEMETQGPQLLPDTSWIAIVCGVSKEQWISQGQEQDSELPDQFYVAPRDVYMPDLTAIADVLLGKLGYGTVSECVDACTPFVYVSRPLFIEEHGLRLLLDREGVGLELSRHSYEAGEWAAAVEEAWLRGKDHKAMKRSEMAKGDTIDRRQVEGQEMAATAVAWVRMWQKDG